MSVPGRANADRHESAWWFRITFVCRSIWHRMWEPTVFAGAMGVGLAAALGAQDPGNIRSFWSTFTLSRAAMLFGASLVAYTVWQALTETMLCGMALAGTWRPGPTARHAIPPHRLAQKSRTHADVLRAGSELVMQRADAEAVRRAAVADTLIASAPDNVPSVGLGAA